MQPFLEAIQQRPLLFDGAIGTELYRRGVFLTNNFEELSLTKRALVMDVHRDYIKAGAEVITTNSYGASRHRLESFGLEAKTEEINRSAAEIARHAAGTTAWVAGSIGPSGLSAAGLIGSSLLTLEDSLELQIRGLVAGDVDLLLIETVGRLAEIQIMLAMAKRIAPQLPVAATMRFEPTELLEDGSNPEDVAKALLEMGADVIGANCGEGPGLVFNVAQKMLGVGLPVIAQPNAGAPEAHEGRTVYVSNPEYFGVYGRRMLKAGLSAVGGCCGTTPEHIRRMSSALRMMRHRDVQVEARDEDLRIERAPVEQRSSLAQKMASGEFVVSVEVNPPAGLDPKTALDAAKLLAEAGADAINIADGPRATVRMSNLAEALLIQDKLGLDVLLHVCCRDRNLLGLQSDILGAHVLGIRNLVIITGDPPKLGDYPDATAVYDLDSVGLLRLVDGYNHGVDPAGKSMGDSTAFWMATGAEPAALDYEREIRRLESKVEAGADFIMTQPVYDPAHVERFLDDIAHLNVPVLLGLLPLASYRNAEFLHNNVPGMSIPEAIRERMRTAGKGAAARAEGVAIAQEALDAVRSRVQGAYIMPPLGRYEMAVQILESIQR